MIPLEVPAKIAAQFVIEQRSTFVPDECWAWTGQLRRGYGTIWIGGRDGGNVTLHRYIYVLLGLTIPEGLQLDHLCRVRECSRPSHLEPVTARVNKIRGMATRTECSLGHKLDGLRKSTYPGSGPRRYCKICQARMQREARARKKVSA